MNTPLKRPRHPLHNLVLGSDGYKYGRDKQYPPGTDKILAYLESRGTDTDVEENVFFGLQYIVKNFLEGRRVSAEDVEHARRRVDRQLGPNNFNYDGWMHIVEEHDGRLPVRIRAVPEGTVVPLKNVLMTVESTDSECYWLSTFLETILHQVWAPITIASNSRAIREIVKRFYQETVDQGIVDFQVHDFGFRGVSSVESAALLGAAHLTAFDGSDTTVGALLAEDYYDASDWPASGIPASEHSVMTMWRSEDGPFDDGETNAMLNMLKQYEGGLVSVVSDSFSIRNAVTHKWGHHLKDEVLNRDGKLVIRPDSGDPVFTTAWIIEQLYDEFGGHVNDKGYKVLNEKVSVIQGDGIDRQMIVNVLENLRAKGFAASNLVFGSGGGLLQRFDRDTFKFAVKACKATVNGDTRDTRKRPMEFDADGNYTASFKRSKAGDLALDRETMTTVQRRDTDDDVLEPVFENGRVLRSETFDDIRARARA